jgi:hypothetical protein
LCLTSKYIRLLLIRPLLQRQCYVSLDQTFIDVFVVFWAKYIFLSIRY